MDAPSATSYPPPMDNDGDELAILILLVLATSDGPLSPEDVVKRVEALEAAVDASDVPSRTAARI